MRLFTGIFAALMLITSAATAYGPTGHRVIAELAFRHLSPEARAAVEAILGDELMAEASTWPDEMRSSPEEFFRRTANVYHYINLPDGVTYEESEKNPGGDALTALENFTKVVKDENASKEDKALALRFIIHIVGDLHQPLHAGRSEDRGGNRIDVAWFGEMSNLHKVWDEDLIDHKDLSFTEWTNFLDPKIKANHIAEWQQSQPIDWVRELISYRSDIYKSAENGILSWDYVYKYTPLVKSQLSKGGIRLAGYLNEMFKK
ncbi:S1/P1 nuclease [Kordiimonas laminariae]|uniref:S1/P1 nuclease n=1 Tax=Kordiimonas laminariae TaxID=2917717 RepID=UPI001FF33111|nr:S1/P1 nuclease [Kordiimonas laminariae]MCK0068875.1 S1/P1 nuclease [Kordiimonas laminariae]